MTTRSVICSGNLTFSDPSLSLPLSLEGVGLGCPRFLEEGVEGSLRPGDKRQGVRWLTEVSGPTKLCAEPQRLRSLDDPLPPPD